MFTNNVTGTVGTDALYEQGTKPLTKSELDANDFMQLLVTQLKNQDPTAPMDNTDFMNQTTQFNMLDQMTEMNQNIAKLVEGDSLNDQTGQLLSAANYLGKTIEYNGNAIKLDGNNPKLTFSLDYAPYKTQLLVSNPAGKVVKNVMLDGMEQGINTVQWDGTDMEGNQVDDGIYYYKVIATTPDGEEIPNITFSSGVVEGAEIADGKLMFNVNGVLVSTENVYSVRNPEEQPATEADAAE